MTILTLTKVDVGMMEDVGTSANQLVQLDSNAKIPAVDGSLLTGMSTSLSGSSDPTLSTNPSTGVGTKFLNTTDGEMFICTNATAGANVWKNVGAGTGNIVPIAVYGGTTYGYYAGGTAAPGDSSRIEKWSFTSDGNSVDATSDLLTAVHYTAGSCSTTHGYTCSGKPSGPYTDQIQKWAFASTANATDVGNSIVSGEGVSGHSSETHGYTSGVYQSNWPTGADTIQKWSFSTDGNATDVGNLSGGNSYGPSSWSDFISSYGWAGSVGFVTGWTYKDNIEKFSYTSDGNSIDVCNMFSAGGNRTSCNSADYGYAMGGATYDNTIQKFSMASGTNGTDVGNLTVGKHNIAIPGASSTTYGYSAGGQISGNPRVDVIDKFSFSSDGNASDVGDLTEAKYWGANAHVVTG